MKAKGLWGYLQSKPDGWDFSADRISLECTDGRESILSGLRELEDGCYLQRIKFQNAAGQWEWEYILKEGPESGFPSTDKPTTVQASTENTSTNKDIYINKENKKTNIFTENKFSEEISYQPIDEEGEELQKYAGVTDLKRKPSKPFSWNRELRGMKIAPQKVAKIVGLYVAKRDLSYSSYEQWYPEKARLLKEAVPLKGYNGHEIKAAMDYCDDKWPDEWTLSTVSKYIARALKESKN